MMYEDHQEEPTISSLQYHFKPRGDYWEAYTTAEREDPIDAFSDDDDIPTHVPPKIRRPRRTSQYYTT